MCCDFSWQVLALCAPWRPFILRTIPWTSCCNKRSVSEEFTAAVKWTPSSPCRNVSFYCVLWAKIHHYSYLQHPFLHIWPLCLCRAVFRRFYWLVPNIQSKDRRTIWYWLCATLPHSGCTNLWEKRTHQKLTCYVSPGISSEMEDISMCDNICWCIFLWLRAFSGLVELEPHRLICHLLLNEFWHA